MPRQGEERGRDRAAARRSQHRQQGALPASRHSAACMSSSTRHTLACPGKQHIAQTLNTDGATQPHTPDGLQRWGRRWSRSSAHAVSQLVHMWDAACCCPASQRRVRHMPCGGIAAAHRRLLAFCRHGLGSDGEALQGGERLGHWSAGIAASCRHTRCRGRHAMRAAHCAARPAAAGHAGGHGCDSWGRTHSGGQLAGGRWGGGALQAKGIGSCQQGVALQSQRRSGCKEDRGRQASTYKKNVCPTGKAGGMAKERVQPSPVPHPVQQPINPT